MAREGAVVVHKMALRLSACDPSVIMSVLSLVGMVVVVAVCCVNQCSDACARRGSGRARRLMHNVVAPGEDVLVGNL